MPFLDDTPNDCAPRLAAMAEVLRARLGDLSDVQDARGRSGVVAAYAAFPARRRSRRVMLALATAATLLVTGWAGARFMAHRPLTFAMSEGTVQPGGYFQVLTQERPDLRFSDGTVLTLETGTRGRVTSVDEHGARLMLDDGLARVRVVKRPGSRWVFDAGPFMVEVRGTDLTVGWRADEGRLDVQLHSGAITVTGPLSEQPMALRPGQWLTMRLATHEVLVREFDRASPPSLSRGPSEPSASAEARPAANPIVPIGTERPPAASATTTSRWTAARAKPTLSRPRRVAVRESEADVTRREGYWQRVLDAAKERGFDSALAESSSDELALLADAARYVHEDDLATQALIAQRKRFPGTTRAKDAAFLLGRLVEARPGGAREAIDWYDRHLAEAPDSAYVGEALGRKMVLVARQQGTAAARPIANQYLQRYPDGSYARAARAYAGKP